MLTIAVVACGPSGGLGTVPPAPPTPAPSADPGPPDMTPEPSATPPTPERRPRAHSPSRRPRRHADARPPRRPRPRATRWSSAPTTSSTATSASKGSCPTLREVPETPAVARAAMEALLRGEILADYDRPRDGDPRRHAPARPVDPRRRRDRRPVARVRIGRRQRLGVLPARPGRLHADPVPDRRGRPVPGRRQAP